jgi:ATP-dependent exoDNAse (exonuclease V) beta subunit
MDLLTDTAYINPSQTHIPPPMPPAMPAPMAAHPQPQQHRGPTNTMPPPPPRTSVSSASALTPPEETALQTRKRLQAPDNASAPNTGQPPDKRRRTAAPGYLDLTQQQHHQQQQPQQTTAAASSVPTVPSNGPANPSASTTTSATPSAGSALAETLHLLAEALRTTRGAKPVPGWQEQAMDIFFRDFGAEDMDLQLKIAEKVLTDENKAMVFCKMPDVLRRHWVKRLREVHNRIA